MSRCQNRTKYEWTDNDTSSSSDRDPVNEAYVPVRPKKLLEDGEDENENDENSSTTTLGESTLPYQLHWKNSNRAISNGNRFPRIQGHGHAEKQKLQSQSQQQLFSNNYDDNDDLEEEDRSEALLLEQDSPSLVIPNPSKRNDNSHVKDAIITTTTTTHGIHHYSSSVPFPSTSPATQTLDTLSQLDLEENGGNLFVSSTFSEPAVQQPQPEKGHEPLHVPASTATTSTTMNHSNSHPLEKRNNKKRGRLGIFLQERHTADPPTNCTTTTNTNHSHPSQDSSKERVTGATIKVLQTLPNRTRGTSRRIEKTDIDADGDSAIQTGPNRKRDASRRVEKRDMNADLHFVHSSTTSHETTTKYPPPPDNFNILSIDRQGNLGMKIQVMTSASVHPPQALTRAMSHPKNKETNVSLIRTKLSTYIKVTQVSIHSLASQYGIQIGDILYTPITTSEDAETKKKNSNQQEEDHRLIQSKDGTLWSRVTSYQQIIEVVQSPHRPFLLGVERTASTPNVTALTKDAPATHSTNTTTTTRTSIPTTMDITKQAKLKSTNPATLVSAAVDETISIQATHPTLFENIDLMQIDQALQGHGFPFPVPFCKKCNVMSTEYGKDQNNTTMCHDDMKKTTRNVPPFHHPWCPKHSDFLTSGAKQRLILVLAGVKDSCVACTFEYKYGRVPSSRDQVKFKILKNTKELENNTIISSQQVLIHNEKCGRSQIRTETAETAHIVQTAENLQKPDEAHSAVPSYTILPVVDDVSNMTSSRNSCATQRLGTNSASVLHNVDTSQIDVSLSKIGANVSSHDASVTNTDDTRNQSTFSLWQVGAASGCKKCEFALLGKTRFGSHAGGCQLRKQMSSNTSSSQVSVDRIIMDRKEEGVELVEEISESDSYKEHHKKMQGHSESNTTTQRSTKAEVTWSQTISDSATKVPSRRPQVDDRESVCFENSFSSGHTESRTIRNSNDVASSEPSPIMKTPITSILKKRSDLASTESSQWKDESLTPWKRTFSTASAITPLPLSLSPREVFPDSHRSVHLQGTAVTPVPLILTDDTSKPLWVRCPNPWGELAYEMGDFILLGPADYDRHARTYEKSDLGHRFNFHPFDNYSITGNASDEDHLFRSRYNYSRTHVNPVQGGTHVLRLERDKLGLRSWGFTVCRHDFGGACLVDSIEPLSPAEAATVVGYCKTNPSHDSSLKLNDMILCVNGKSVGGMTIIDFEVELEISGTEMLLVVARYKGRVSSIRQSSDKWDTVDSGESLHWVEMTPDSSAENRSGKGTQDLLAEDSWDNREYLEKKSESDCQDNLVVERFCETADELQKNCNQLMALDKDCSNYDEVTDNVFWVSKLRQGGACLSKDDEHERVERGSTKMLDTVNPVVEETYERIGVFNKPLEAYDVSLDTVAIEDANITTQDDSKRDTEETRLKSLKNPPYEAVTDDVSLSFPNENSRKRKTSRHKNSCVAEDWEDDENPWLGCICGKTHTKSKQRRKDTTLFWIQCDTCKAWFECSPTCVGFGAKDAETITTWECHICVCDTHDDTSTCASVQVETKSVTNISGPIEASAAKNSTTVPCVDDLQGDSNIPSPRAKDTFAFPVGAIVNVTDRTWAGCNKPGGVGTVVSYRHCQETNDVIYHVRYVLGGREHNVQSKYVVLYEEMTSSSSSLPSGTRRSRT